MAGRPSLSSSAARAFCRRASVSPAWTGRRIVRPVLAMPRVIAWRIHHVAYVENLKPLRQSNFSTACIRPRLPSWIRSSSGRPDAWYFLAIETTRRRFDCTNARSASSPSRAARRSSRFLAAVRSLPTWSSSAIAALPASICLASRTSSSLVSSGYCPMSVRYRRTRSSSSRSTRSFATNAPRTVSLFTSR